MAQDRNKTRLGKTLGKSKRGIAAAAIVLVVLVSVSGLFLVVNPLEGGGVTLERVYSIEDEPSDGREASDSSDEKSETSLVVHVDGAVQNPGVYELEGDVVRVNDAVMAAGGFTSEALTSVVNLAAPLADGSQVVIPRVSEGGGDTSEGAVATVLTSQGTGLVNINSAGPDDLQSLNGIGEATAAAIIKDRQINGPFASIEDIMRVSGIGEKKFEAIRESICV